MPASASVSLSELDFDPVNTFESGQTFRWYPIDGDKKKWVGIVSGSVIKASRDVAIIVAQDYYQSSNRSPVELLEDYFSFNDRLDQIISSFPKDDFLSKAIREFGAIRVLTQNPWECLVSFICSIDSNIPSIRKKIENLCSRFGKKISSDSVRTYYSFPEPKILSRASAKELISCKLGFRWKYVKFVAQRVAEGDLDLESLNRMPYTDAHNRLVSRTSGLTFGVGPKVADCALLFSFHKTEAFPIDVWIRRCLDRNYSNITSLDPVANKTGAFKSYYKLSERMRSFFGKYAGYAQQYLYIKTRSEAIRSIRPA
jgi:N-glycosylase/DNA lyase